MKLMKLQDAKDVFYNLHYFIKILNINVFDTVSVTFQYDDNDHTTFTFITIYDEYGFEYINIYATEDKECYMSEIAKNGQMFITNDYGKVIEL